MALPLNLALMKNPLNWVVVTLMVVIGGLALHLIFPEGNPVTTQDN